MKYINLTPRWLELFSTWQFFVNDAVKVKKPDQMERFWETVKQAFTAADRYNDLVLFLRKQRDWKDEDFQHALDQGEALHELERNTVHEEESQS